MCYSIAPTTAERGKYGGALEAEVVLYVWILGVLVGTTSEAVGTGIHGHVKYNMEGRPVSRTQVMRLLK